MWCKNDKKEITIYDKVGEVIEELFQSLLKDIKFGWKHKWKTVILSLIVLTSESLWIVYTFLIDWINPVNPVSDNDVFNMLQNCIKSWRNWKTYTKKISKIKPFINITGKEEIIHQEKRTEKSLRKIIQQLLLMCYMLKNKYISHLQFKTQCKMWKSNYSFDYFKQDGILFQISFSSKLFVILRGMMSRHDGDLYYFNCLHSFKRKNQLESHMRK